MTAPMHATTTSPLFSATLRPERSLHAAGGWIALVLAGIVGTPFLLAMPEFFVPGLIAFVLAGLGLTIVTMRQGCQTRQSQTVTLWPDQLELVLSQPGAQPLLHRFDAKAIRIRLVRDSFERTTNVFLRHGGDEVELGQFLSLDDRSSFARALGSALRQARRMS